MARYDNPSDPLYDPATAAPPRDAADAVMRDRVRVAAILDSAEGRRYPAMARELAIQRGMGAEDAISLLGKFDAENPYAAADNPYRAALDREANITIGSPAGAGTGADPKAARLAELRAAGKSVDARKGYDRGHA